MQKPYIKKTATISKFDIWIVDGSYIRTNIDEEFTNFGQHYRFKFIPENEFWIDKESVPGEEHFYIEHLLVENRLMSRGVDYNTAIEKADLVEEKERRKVDFIKKGIKISEFKKDYVNKIHKKLLKEHSGKIKVWIVDGELVRDLFYIDFTEGGHDKVYNFIPENEVWLEDDLSVEERKFVLLHELHERNLMSKGFEYKKAHRSASHVEYFCRHHPKETPLKIMEEVNKNNS